MDKMYFAKFYFGRPNQPEADSVGASSFRLQYTQAIQAARQIARMRGELHRDAFLAVRQFGQQRKSRLEKFSRLVVVQLLGGDNFAVHQHVEIPRTGIAAPEGGDQLL